MEQSENDSGQRMELLEQVLSLLAQASLDDLREVLTVLWGTETVSERARPSYRQREKGDV